MKQQKWTVQVHTESTQVFPEDALFPPDEHTDLSPVTTDAPCTVIYRLSRLRGRITLRIGTDTFLLPAGVGGCRAARREIFRLGDQQAVLVVDRAGHAQLLWQGEALPEDA